MSLIKSTLLGAWLLAGLLAAGPTRGPCPASGNRSRPVEQSAQSRPPVQKPIQAAENPAPSACWGGGPEQRIALVIGNSNYQNIVQLANPANDTKAVAQLLNPRASRSFQRRISATMR